MAKVLMIGAGGVATVAAFKIAQNAEVFTDFMIASRRKEKCDKIVADIHKAGYKMNIQTAIFKLSARTGHQPRSALSGPDDYGCLSGMWL